MGLSGNDLVVFALINGFSQNGQGCFYGSLAYICETCGIAKRTAVYILQGLVERGFITKTETYHNGVKSVAYQASAKYAMEVQKMHRGSAENAPNNKEDININKRENRRFIPPTIDEVRAYCTERNNGIDPEEFVVFYTSKGWMVGKSPMKDWRSAIITWEKAKKKKPSYQPQQKESAFSRQLRVMDEMYGTNYHEQAYGKKEAYDEQ